MLQDTHPDGLVKSDDSWVLRLLLSCKLLWDIALVLFKLIIPMCESKEVGIMGKVKGNCPVSMGGNRFRCIL